MTLELLSGIQGYLTASFGSTYIFVIGIIIFFTIAFLIAQVDFRVIALLDTILVIGFSKTGMIPSWIEPAFWILIIGIGIYLLIVNLMNR